MGDGKRDLDRSILSLLQDVEKCTYEIHVRLHANLYHRQVAQMLSRLRRAGLVESGRTQPIPGESCFVDWRLTPAGREAVRS